mmetsp:Transcript_107558/g.304152  ORF Transcript_107558/g.304152 Transcript_107558/m.304152 type:complete len:649 (+) Transcript_107558:53-1999(+)
MKPRGAHAAMLRVAAALAMLAPSTAAAARRSRSDGAASLSQIRDTLENLRRSIEDAARESSRLFASRQHWCDSYLQTLEGQGQAANASLGILQRDLEEHEAAVDEAEGTALQLQADTALLQRTVNQTEELLQAWKKTKEAEEAAATSLPNDQRPMKERLEADGRLARALLESKRQALASLRAEESVVTPMLAQLKAAAGELERRHADSRGSLTDSNGFVNTLRDVCGQSSRRSLAQASANSAVKGAVMTALQAIGQIADPKASHTVEAASLLQLKQEPAPATDEDLFDIFGGQADSAQKEQEPAVRAPVREEALPATNEEDVAELEAAPDSEESPVAPALVEEPLPAAATAEMRASIREQLAQLRREAEPGGARRVWCEQEQVNSLRVMMLAQASAGQLEAEVDVHEGAAKQLEEDLKNLEMRIKALNAAAKAAADSSANETAILASRGKDYALATKILEQAGTILADLKSSGSLEDTGTQHMHKALDALTAAKAAFQKQAQALNGIRQEVTQGALGAAAGAEAAVEAFKHEQRGLEMARDSHMAQHASSTEGKRASEAELQQASAYFRGIQEECMANATAAEVRERNAQERALEDSEKVLEGGHAAATRHRGSRGLRGQPSPARSPSPNLSPLERAAAEMGVAVDGA